MPRCTRVLSLLPLLLWCAEHTVSGEPRSNPREHDRGARPWSRQRCGGKAPGNRADIVTRWGSTIDPAVAAPLPEYPRPQLARHESTWLNLNGLWQWEPTTGTNGTASPPPFGRSLNRTILVPFPAESCLSGIGENHPYQWYRTTFDGSKAFAGENSLIHFGAVDWYSTVYLNTVRLGDHKGGYDAFSFNSSAIRPGENELLVFVYDPSELGGQPFGKQRAWSIAHPGVDGNKYTPTSGIWQTVWIEKLPLQYIADLDIETNLTTLMIRAHIRGVVPSTAVSVRASVESAWNHTVSQLSTAVDERIHIASLATTIPNPRLWSPASPFLYNLSISLLHANVVVDTVRSYFGMRTVSIGRGMNGTSQLLLNGRKFFAAGWLDQSFWPDGQYTAPTDAALAFDLAALKQFGMNTVRLHQKINPDRWYFHADRLGVVVLQDMVQHFNYRYAGTWIKNETIQNLPINTTQFTAEWTSAIRGLKNHPAIIQWNIFNEGEYEQHAWGCTKRSCPILDVTRALDQTRLVDFDSGGGGNNLGIGDANDVHSYGPDPTSAAAATPSRYGMVGEYGSIGWSAPGHEWVTGMCHGNTIRSAAGADALLVLVNILANAKAAGNISAAVYTQSTDVELECNGFHTYDRVCHYDDVDKLRIRAAFSKLTMD